MTPVELIEKALREHLRLRLGKRALTDAMLDKPITLSGGEAEDAARIAVEALAGAGMVVAAAADLKTVAQLAAHYLQFMEAEPGELEAIRRVLPAALPERNADA